MKNLKKIIALAVVASMAFAMFGCATSSKKSKKDSDDSEISEKDVSKIAKSFADALIDRDADGIKKVSDDSAEDVSFDFDMNEGAEDVYKYWFKKFSAEVDEDSIEVDDDSATVTIKVVYPEIVSIDSVMSADEWEDYIDDSDDGEEEYELELSYDEDDEKLLVSNADDTVKDYVKLISSPYFDVYEAPSYTTFGTLSTKKSSYTTSDEIDVTVNCDEIDDLEAAEIEIEVTDPNGDSVFTGSLFFYSGAESSMSFSGSDCKEDGTYTITATCSDMVLTETFTFKAGDDDTDPTLPSDDNGGDEEMNDFMSHLKPAKDECFGKMDGQVYTNEYFGFKMDMSSMDLILMTKDDLSDMGSEEASVYDFLAMSSDGNDMCMIAIYEADEETAQKFSLVALDEEVEIVNYDGIDFYVTMQDEFGMAIILKDNALLFILAGGSDVQGTFDSFMDTLSAI